MHLKHDLKLPCKNCPFANTPDRITFACRERAEEIEESAYRNGFPCHLSAVHLEEDDDPLGEGGYVPGPETQHCAGAAAMFLNGGYDSWPGIDNDEDLAAKWSERLYESGALKVAFQSVEEFLDANE